MLRSLPFVAVRQQHGEAAVATPFGFAGGDELVNQHLCAVGEVAELRFPDGQPLRFGGGIAVLEAEHRRFGEDGVDDARRRLAVVEMGERGVAVAGVLVVNDRVAVREGAAPAVLAGNAHRMTLFNQRRISEILRRTPIERLLARRHFHPRGEHFGDDGVWRETGGRGEDFRAEAGQIGRRISGFDRGVHVRLAEYLPLVLQPGIRAWRRWFRRSRGSAGPG